MVLITVNEVVYVALYMAVDVKFTIIQPILQALLRIWIHRYIEPGMKLGKGLMGFRTRPDLQQRSRGFAEDEV